MDEDSTTSKEHSTCFAAPEDISDDDRANKHAFAVDSEGKLCFVRLNSGRYAISENEDEIEARYANVTREFCPLWPASKQCLLDHLNGDRCSEDDKKKVLQFSSLNEELVFSELLCNPLRKTHFFNTMKSMKKEKLWDCLELESVKTVLNDCSTKRSETANAGTYQHFLHVLSCVTPGLR
ncbi:unnamed protein product, partial [Allacma fusca]